MYFVWLLAIEVFKKNVYLKLFRFTRHKTLRLSRLKCDILTIISSDYPSLMLAA